MEFLLAVTKLHQKTAAQLPDTEIGLVYRTGATAAVRIAEIAVSKSTQGINLLFSLADVATSNDRSTEDSGPVLGSFFHLLNFFLMGGLPEVRIRVGDLAFLTLVGSFVLLILVF